MTKPTMESRSVLSRLDIQKNDAQTRCGFARMLITVTMLGSIHAVRLVVSSEATVKDVILAALTAYAKEGRLLLRGCDADDYTLHFSQFSLQSLNPHDSMKHLGGRSFVLSLKKKQNHPSSDPKIVRVAKSWWNVLGIL